MNAHDSEKVVGTLLSEGYSQVETPDEAGLVLYNTCSIRDKAEQKVFSSLQNFKREGMKDKVFGVLGCVASPASVSTTPRPSTHRSRAAITRTAPI